MLLSGAVLSLDSGPFLPSHLLKTITPVIHLGLFCIVTLCLCLFSLSLLSLLLSLTFRCSLTPGGQACPSVFCRSTSATTPLLSVLTTSLLRVASLTVSLLLPHCLRLAFCPLSATETTFVMVIHDLFLCNVLFMSSRPLNVQEPHGFPGPPRLPYMLSLRELIQALALDCLYMLMSPKSLSPQKLAFLKLYCA